MGIQSDTATERRGNTRVGMGDHTGHVTNIIRRERERERERERGGGGCKRANTVDGVYVSCQ